MRPAFRSKTKEDARMFERILIAVDGSLDADAAVKAGVLISKMEGASVDLCHAFHIPHQYRADLADATEDALRADAEKILAHAARLGEEEGVTAATHLLDEGHPAEAVLELAEKLRSSLIVMGVRGKSPDRVRSLGSVSAAVSQGAKCSVLLVRRTPGS
jgi:nucleotide-binding universal stress UspA family protein